MPLALPQCPSLSPRTLRPGACHVKTPRPDISIGLCTDVILNALQSQGFTRIEVRDYLSLLQRTQDLNRGEPILCSEPTQSSLGIQFPFLLVEGKAYATGKPIFDAQNQTAVS